MIDCALCFEIRCAVCVLRMFVCMGCCSLRGQPLARMCDGLGSFLFNLSKELRGFANNLSVSGLWCLRSDLPFSFRNKKHMFASDPALGGGGSPGTVLSHAHT